MKGRQQRQWVRRFAAVLAGLGALVFWSDGPTSLRQDTLFPENDLHLRPARVPSDLTQQEFDAILGELSARYAPIVAAKKATLKINGLWSNDQVNANATQFGSSWVINIYGGLARRPEMTKDGLSLAVCHELGHHLGGFPTVSNFFSSWAACEGQSDYFSSLSCLKELWREKTEDNAAYRDLVPKAGKARCDQAVSAEAERDLCYRILTAATSLGALAAVIYEEETPAFDTPDQEAVATTDIDHPDSQCRLDTLAAGTLCQKRFDPQVIPKTEAESKKYVCTESAGEEIGARPRCWFAPKL